MPITGIANGIAGSSNTNDVTVSGLNTTGASLLVALVGSEVGGTGGTFSDNKGNTWTPLTLYTGQGHPQIQFYYCSNPIVDTGHSFTYAGSLRYPTLQVSAYSGTVLGASPVAYNGNAPGTNASTIQPGSVSPGSLNGCLFLAGLGSQATGTVSIDSGFTIIDQTPFVTAQHYTLAVAHNIQGSAASLNPTWTNGSSTPIAAAIVVFPASLAITSTSPLAGGTVGSAYSQHVDVTGGTGSITSAVTSGFLPPGLSLGSSTGYITGTPTASGIYSFDVTDTDSLGATSTRSFTITIAVFVWPTGSDMVPKTGVVFWHEAQRLAYADVANVSAIPDLGRNAIDLACSSAYPTFDIDAANGKPAVHFAGTSNPLISAAGAMTGKTIRHLFVIAAYEDATFSGNNGLIGPINAGSEVLKGNGSTATKFHDQGYGGVFTYRKGNNILANSNELAPMSNAIRILELVKTDGLMMDDLQIGKHYGSTDKWKGLWVMDLAYDRVLNDQERYSIYIYIAQVLNIWQQDVNGYDVFPFYSNRAVSLEAAQERYLSEPYNGDPVALERGTLRDALSLNFTLRSQAEFDAAKLFYRTHQTPTRSAFRDFRYYPPKDRVVRITSNLRERGDDTSLRFNYSFDVQEV